MRYTREDGCRAWLTRAEARSDTITALLQEAGSAEAVYDAFMSTCGKSLADRLTTRQLGLLRAAGTTEEMHRMMVAMRDGSIGILSQEDFGYPDALRELPDAPALLFYQGDPDCLMGRCLTMIGARKCSPAGVELTRTVAQELAENGVVIVSGLAMGIDAAAHEGCLAGGGITAAVLGCGHDVEYPVENLRLKKRIVETGGVLLSEYAPGVIASGYHFPVRNRILSGLSRATIFMEGQIRSGSMSTVQHALDQGKEVYAYPDSGNDEWREGNHQLLREGATYFSTARDILEDMGWLEGSPPKRKEAAKELPPLSDDQRRLFTLICRGEPSFDQLCDETKLDPPTVSGALTMLQLLGLIRALPGKTYSKA